MSESSWSRRHGYHADGMHSRSSPLSARKLVGAAWQMNDQEVTANARDAAARRSSAHHRRCASSVEILKRSRTKSNKALDAAAAAADHDDEWFSDKLSNGAAREVLHTRPQDWRGSAAEERMAQLQGMYSSLTASKELVRVLATIWGPGDLSPSTASLLSALRSEVDLARAHARQLVREQGRRSDEIEALKKRLAEEAHAWRCRQREKVAATVKVVVAELDGQRRSRRRAERVNAKLGKALAETESSLRAAEAELERQTRSRERLEKVCDELVRGASASSAGRGEVEEMRREAEMAQDELDREREMLRLADELREERVQMKLLEARLQFEEKNAVVEQLRCELEAFLETKKDHQESPASDVHHAIDDHFQLAPPRASRSANGVAVFSKSSAWQEEEDDDEEGSAGDNDSEVSDMHSIELNVDGNSKDCSWSYTAASKEMTTTTTSNNAASSFSVSDRGTECAADPWAGAAFDRRSPEKSEGGAQWDDGECSERSSRDLDEDSERYEAIKNLREQMLAGHGFLFLSRADDGDVGNGEREHQHHRYGLMCQIDQEGIR